MGFPRYKADSGSQECGRKKWQVEIITLSDNSREEGKVTSRQ